MIAIIDYGAGNLKSVKKAFDFLGAESRVVSGPEGLEGVERIVLPGVGAFGAAANRLTDAGLFEPIRAWLAADRPFLGICLGLQLLFEGSAETPGAAGFGIFHGRCLRFTEGKVPQIGWNQIRGRREEALLEGITDDSFFYFLHGYYCAPQDDDVVVAETEYGTTYASAVGRGNIMAVQFHPEKSGELGLRLLKNWL